MDRITNGIFPFSPKNPENAKRMVERGMTLLEKGKPRSAAKAFQKAKVQDHTSSNAALGRAYALEKLGKIEDALREYQNALSLLLDGPSALKLEIHNKIGFCQAKLGKYKDAIDSFKLALEQLQSQESGQGAVAIHHNLGVCLHKEGEYAEAETSLKKAAELGLNSVKTHAMIAHCMILVGRGNDALQYLEEQLSKNNIDADKEPPEYLFLAGYAASLNGNGKSKEYSIRLFKYLISNPDVGLNGAKALMNEFVPLRVVKDCQVCLNFAKALREGNYIRASNEYTTLAKTIENRING